MNIKELKDLISIVGNVKVSICSVSPFYNTITEYNNRIEFLLDDSINGLELSNELKPVDILEGGSVIIWVIRG